MSLTCMHALADASLHSDPARPWDYCAGCADVPASVARDARYLDRNVRPSMDLARYVNRHMFRLEREMAVDPVQHDGYARRHAVCGRVVTEQSREWGFREARHWRCECSSIQHLADIQTYEGWPLPTSPPAATTSEELDAQAHWHRASHAVLTSMIRETPGGRPYQLEEDWPRRVAWCVYVVAAYVEGQVQSMGSYWEYMQIYLDAWTEHQSGGRAVL